jgi:hypothetical protein
MSVHKHLLVFLPHPNEHRSKKTLEANIGKDGLWAIRAHLKGENHLSSA